MRKQKFLLKLFGEIMVKGAAAKRDMINTLYQNLHTLLQTLDEKIEIKKFSDKIEVLCDTAASDAVRKRLLDTPGIDYVLEAVHFPGCETMEQIKQHSGESFLHTLQGKRFVVRAKRTGEHPFNSSQIERAVGGYLLAHAKDAKVDLHDPEITVRIELVNRDLYLITDKYKGLGGFPIGSQGEVLSLISGGFDSTVASYLTIARGIKTHYLFFNLGGIAHEIGVKQLAFYLWQRFGASHPVTFVTVDFSDVVTEIFHSVAPSYMGVMLKRLMLQAAEIVADEMGIDALVTGESVAQVSSQTLRNLALIDTATQKLVLRPLALSNKADIIAVADKIGARHFAETMPEYCGVISKNPVTKGSFKRIAKESAAFDSNVLEKAAREARKVSIEEIVDDMKALGDVEIVNKPEKDDIVIDIRAEAETTAPPVPHRKIPFYRLKSEIGKLPKAKRYLLYCEKGVLSRLHAQLLRDEDAALKVGIYRPDA